MFFFTYCGALTALPCCQGFTASTMEALGSWWGPSCQEFMLISCTCWGWLDHAAAVLCMPGDSGETRRALC